MPSTMTDVIDGLSTSVAIKAPCATVSTTNVTLAGLQTFSGRTQFEGDRHLAVGQTNAVDNGIYVASTGSWTRAKDADGARDLVQGTRVMVQSDSIDGIEYELVTDNPIVIDTSALSFELRYGANATYDQTASEVAASVVPLVKSELPGVVNRYAINVTPGTTDLATAMQSAIDSLSLKYPYVQFSDLNAISKPLLIRSTTRQNVGFRGSGRVAAALMPSAVDIKQAAQNINCLIFNQNNNAHLHLESFQFFSSVGFTGVCIYSKELGGADASGQCLFSAVFRDIWFGMSSSNNGFLQGGMENCVVDTFVAEFSKNGVFILEGAGVVDNTFSNCQMNSCNDEFIRQTTDTLGGFHISVSNLHAYTHLRGRLINVKNWFDCTITGVILECDLTCTDGGLFKFQDCTGITVSNCLAITRAGVGTASVGLEFINANSGSFSNIRVNATTGIKFSGTGALDLEFVNCDFTGCTDCLDFSGTNLSGKIKFVNCKFNDAQQRCIIHRSGTLSVDVDFYGCEILNAGLSGNAAFRNVDWAGSGSWNFYNCKIGQNNGSAAAAYYISNAGSGTLRVFQPHWIGTPPTGLADGATVTQIAYRPGYGTDIASAATIAIPNDGDIFNVTGVTNITSVTATNQKGRKVTLIFAGILTFTDGSNLKLAGNLVTTADDAITIVCDGTNWFEVSRSVN